MKKDRKSSKIFTYIKEGINVVYETFCRFPLTLILFIGLTIISIYNVHVPYRDREHIMDLMNRLIYVFVLGIPFSLSINLYFERFKDNIKPMVKLTFYVAELLLLGVYFYFFIPNLENDVHSIRTFLLTAAMVLSFLFIPYLLNKKNFEIYITKIITQATTTGFFTIVIALGISALLFAIKSLLYSNLNSDFYIYTWIITGLIFAPVYFLSQLAKKDDYFNLGDYNKVLKVLLMYIILPVMVAYTLVLYIYFGKIIITKVWPKGIVSYLVISYTAIGILTVFLLTPLRRKSKWVKTFIFSFTKLVFPLLIMMFTSIAIRISEFGITENRYFIIVIGIWAVLSMIYYNINKGRRNILLPISLAIIMLIVSIGPWSAFNVSRLSQSKRFYDILSKYEMIKDGKVIASSEEKVDKKDIIEISEILRYFKNQQTLENLSYLPKGFNMNQMDKVFGFSEQRPSIYKDDKIYYHYNSDDSEPIMVAGYDLLFKCNAYRYQDKGDPFLFQKTYNDNNFAFEIKIDKHYKLYLINEEENIYTYDLKEHIGTIYEKYGGEYNSKHVEIGDLIIIDSNDNLGVMITIDSVSGYFNADIEELHIDSIDMKVLLKFLEN